MANVTLANRWTAADGKRHEGGKTVEVSDAVARELIMRGKARVADAAEPVKSQAAAKPKEGK